MPMNTQMPAKDTSCSGRWEVSRASHKTRPRKAARARPLQGKGRKTSPSASSLTPHRRPPGLQGKHTQGWWEERAV